MCKRGVVRLLRLFAVIPLSGCPSGADLQDPERFLALQAGTAGVTGNSGSSGSAGTAGASGGSGGGITFVPPDCDYRGVLATSCAQTVGCHRPSSNPQIVTPAGLDLLTDGVEARLFNRMPTYQDISCDDPDGGPFPVICVPPGCDEAGLLIKPGDPAGSFLFKKIAGTQGDCGLTMPLSPGKLDAAGRACLEAWITALSNAQYP